VVDERKASALTVDLVRKLDADHVPLRDIGEAVGVSFQRVHQLLNAEACDRASVTVTAGEPSG
jgi:hypothetical protein